MAMKVLIIGAGIIGASTAYQLQKAGAEVTVMDAGGASATNSSFGWINASFFHDAEHFQLRADSIAAYRDLAQELTLPINWCGCLCYETSGAALDAQKAELQELGYAVEDINARRFAELEPHVADPPERCLFFPDEGAAASGLLAGTLLEGAVARGARVLRGVRATGLLQKSGRVTGVRTAQGSCDADHVVLAAGTATEALLSEIDVALPMLTRPALVITTRPVAPILHHILVSEAGELRQLPSGALMMPAAIAHQADAGEIVDDPLAQADAVLARLHKLLPATPLNWAQADLAYRPMPQDGLPVAGAVAEGLYVATMHSGITLGALMGQMIAREVLQGPTNDTARRLASYRPDRFAVSG